MRLYIVRHGVTEWNSEGRIQGHTDIPLSEEGEAQAQRLSDRLSAEPLAAVWSSDLQRAARTAEFVAAPHGLPVRTTPRLRERMMGAWEGLTEVEAYARGYGDRWRKWRQDPVRNAPPGAEALEDAMARILAVRDEMEAAHPEGVVVAVGHGGSLRALLCHAVEAPAPIMHRFALDNASLSLVEYSGPRRRLRFVNDTSHLP